MEKRVFKSNFLKGAVCAALAALLCAALLTCSNSAGGSDAPSSQQSVSSSSRKSGYVTLTGTVSVSGAVPQILADTPDASGNAENGLSRSAYPGIDASGADATMEYFATATCGSDVVNGTFGSGIEAKKFGIELAASKTWSVVVGVRSKTADAEGNKKIYLQSKPWSVTPDPADPTISHNFVPVPNTSGGEGKIELNVKCSVSSNSLRVKFISGPDGVDLSAISAAVTNNGANGKIIKVDSVPSGVYELCLDFLTNPPGNMLEYSSLQTVTVADGMTTNSWVDDANESALSPISGGEFKFNNDNRADLTAAFLGTTVFVGKVSSDSAEPDDSNSGNFLSPFKTITRAAERINAVGKGDLDYYIRVSGEVSGSSSNSAAVIQTLLAAKAKSLTIIGTSGPDADCIKSVTYQHSALNVTTPVPIKLKNIKIVGATGAGNGHAVSAWGSANVIIEDSVEITGADVGVSVSESASVTMKGGTISGNVTAVDLQGGDFILQGGSIPYDTSISSTKKNDVKLASGKVIKVQGDLTAVTGDKIGVTPSERKRGVKVVDTSATTATASAVEGKFLITDPTITATNPLGDEWKVVAVATSTERALKTNAPIYVGKKPDGTTDGSNDNAGTKSAPFATIARACQDMDDAGIDYEINVRGTVSGAQTIPNTLSKDSTTIFNHAKSVTIKGVTALADGVPQDAIDAGSAGTALTVASAVPITIQNLKITKGGGSSVTNGGGISMSSVTDVTISSGALITANKAKNHGGGIYCNGGKLKIAGGKITANEAGGGSDSRGGIGLYANSSAEITMTGGEISSNKNTSDLDVKGGGVKLEGGATFRMSAGEVKDNQTRMHGANFYVNGGKVYLSGTGKITGGYIEATSNNDAIGAAMWLQASNAVFEMSGGEISGNKVKGKTNYTACAGIYVTSGATFTMTGGKIASNEILNGNKLGGAVRLNSDCTFNISGSASIPYGGAVGNNDVYLAQSTSGTPAVTTYAKINIANDITTTGTVATITPQKYRRGMPILSGTNTRLTSYKAQFPLSENDGDWTKNIASSQLTINADVYVAGTSPTTVSGVAYGKGLTVAEGGLGTKSKPFKLISEAVGVFEDATPEAIVTVVGTASDVAQEIPSSFTTSQAVKLTLKGLSSSSVGTIKRYTTAPSSAASDGSALTINSTVPVTIQDLEITGGYKSGNGGGINLTAGTLKLGNGAEIYGNRASQYGGGIAVASGAKLFMYGSSLVGDLISATATSDTLTTSGTTGCSNTAKAGGGIYSNGAVYIGYDGLTGDTPNKHDMDAGYGVCRNYASGSTDSGGGIQNKAGSVLIASGSVSYNQSVNCGGGIFGVGSVTIDEPVTGTKKLVMYGNKAKIGGAIGLYTGCNLTMSGGQIGGNTSAKQNTATEKGGAVYQGATFKVSGSALIYPSTTANTNDVYLPTGTYVTAGSIGTNGNSSSNKMPLTPQEPKRGTQIVLADGVTVNSTLWGKFSLTSDDTGWNREAKTVGTGSSAKNYVALNSPVYVVGTSASSSTRPDTTWGYGTAAGNGTKTSPYSSIADALGCPELSVATEPNTITVAGTLKGIQSISGTVPASLALKGYNTSATIDGNSGGSALTVNASGKTITITSLKITGGSGTAETVSGATQNNGGGIYLKAGTVNLGDNAVITGNNVSTNGGGVYVAASGATLFMYGKALIGDSATSTTLASSSGTSYYANKAASGAGIYNNGGAVYIGYDTSSHASAIYSSTNTWYGVRRNLCTTSGAGIYHASGTLKIASGDISYNFANTSGTTSGGAAYFNANATISGGTFTGNKAANGGAFYIKSSKELTIDGAATITKNVAVLTGGAVCNDGTFTMSAGTIGASGALNTAGNQGGAIYQNGTFNMSGSAVVYADTSNGVSEKNNDVQLTSTDKYITVNGSLSASSVSGYSMIAAVTPSTWKRGNQVIAPDGTNVSSINSTTAGRFAVSDSEWSVRDHSNVGKLNAELWVAGTGYDSTGGVCATKAAGNSNRGTKKQPYASIQTAAEKCWTTDLGFTINISGMISGSTQTIPAENATAGTTLASKITLQGSSNTTDGIDRGLASSSAVSGGSALIINYQGYVDITNLKIMGGNTTGNGGGIQINGSSSLISTRTSSRVNLKNGTLIQQNQAVNGGGVYSYCAILCLSGTATIGSNADTPDRSTASTDLSTGINKATTSGGGIYSTSSYLYFGAAWVGTGPYTTGYTLTKGVYGNVCTVDSNATAANQKKAAGGVYNYGVFYFMSGNINCNYGVMTGGVYNNYSTGYGFCMSGGSIHKNNGCGVYNDTSGEFSMSGDAYIGDSGASSRATSATDCSNSKGGLVNAGTAKLGYSYGSKTKLSGGIYRNYRGISSKNDGGAGIKNTGTLYFDSGTISYNYAYSTQSEEAGGGGIFSNSTVYMTSSSSSQYSCVKDNKCSEAGGGIYLDGSSAKLLMSGYAIIGKAGQTTPPTSATADGANTAKYGAGIGSSGGATICLGYSSFTNMDTNTTESLDDGGICYNYATINGGGIHCQGSSTSSINIYMASGKINANKVYYSNGGTTYGHGGGIWVNMYGTIYMGGGQISKNSAMNNGGGIFTAGKLFMYGNALIGDTGSSVATTGNYGNTAVTGGGVYVTSANGGVFMGCIKEASGGVQYETLNSSYGIRHNYASGASSDIEPSSGIPTGFGGGVYSNKATLYVASGTIGYNLAAKGGGAAILGQYQSLGYTPCLDGANSKIEGNKATADGGGLYIKKDTFEIRGSISSNTAGSDGGGVYNYWSDLEISGSGAKINSNKAQKGGGIFIPEDGSETNGNTSYTILQNGAQVNSNEATYYGGGIYNYDATLEIYASNISYNKATDETSGKGGAMYIRSAGYTRIISGTVTMTPTSGYERQARYNDIYPVNSRAFSIYSADATISGKVYITLPSTVAADAQIISILGTYPYTSLQSNTYLLTTGSYYYNSKTINTSTGKLN